MACPEDCEDCKYTIALEEKQYLVERDAFNLLRIYCPEVNLIDTGNAIITTGYPPMRLLSNLDPGYCWEFKCTVQYNVALRGPGGDLLFTDACVHAPVDMLRNVPVSTLLAQAQHILSGNEEAFIGPMQGVVRLPPGLAAARARYRAIHRHPY